MSTFNASVEIKSSVSNSIANCAMDFAIRCIQECATQHGFNASDEIRRLCLENMTLKTQAKKLKEPKPKVNKKSVVPMPFIAELVDFSLCNALTYNKGLFTQCCNKPVDASVYCKKCTEYSDAVTGIPICGTIQQRLATGLYEFKDSKGRSPVSYIKFLEKKKFTILFNTDSSFF